EEAVPQLLLRHRGRGSGAHAAYHGGHHRGATPSESGSPPSAATPRQSAHTSAVAGCNDPHRATRNRRSSGCRRRAAEVPAASSIEAATSAAVTPASSFARHTHWFVSGLPGSASTRRAASVTTRWAA